MPDGTTVDITTTPDADQASPSEAEASFRMMLRTQRQDGSRVWVVDTWRRGRFVQEGPRERDSNPAAQFLNQAQALLAEAPDQRAAFAGICALAVAHLNALGTPMVVEQTITARPEPPNGAIDREHAAPPANGAGSAKAETGHRQGGLAGYKLRRVVEYIRANSHRDLVLAEMAALVEMSECHFARAFKQATGVTPHKYFIAQRIERAKSLLLGRSTPIIDIALRVGFKNQSHFTAKFREVTGVTPKAYRNGVR